MKKNISYQDTPQLVTFVLPAMGCQIQISLHVTEVSTQQAQAAIKHQIALLKVDVQQRLARWEQLFNRFDNTSELMRLNSQTNQWTEVSAELFAVLQRAIGLVPKTQGLVTPTLLNTLWDIGYKHSFETLHKQPMPVVLADNQYEQDASRAHQASQHIQRIQLLTSANGQHRVYLPTGIALDLNGYVKGWCAMQLAEYISQLHDWQMPCLVDMGGDMAVGVPSKQDINNPITWAIAIAKPYVTDGKQVQDEEDVAIIQISSGAVATSGQDYRRWWHKGSWQHHLIDPYHARPVKSDVLTATILVNDAVTAEAYAKYCVLLGSKAAMKWLCEHRVAAILVDTNHQVLPSPAMYPNLLAI